MNASQPIIDSLLKIKQELTIKYFVSSIGLFGSVIGDDYSSSTSDVDIIVDFSKPIGIEFIDLAEYLESVIKRKVDIDWYRIRGFRNRIVHEYFGIDYSIVWLVKDSYLPQLITKLSTLKNQ
jgi:predicted nucleotidyltransferase